jgi:1-deoxy-D-xylulose-5-phosphate reductoisomerase
MGRKITVDSATLVNKGLEIIEAHWLYDVPAGNIEAVIHPQSIIHSMIRLTNGAVYAQMYKPDMRVPIHKALTWTPEGRGEDLPCPFGHLDCGAESVSLTFETPDTERFPLLRLAYQALAAGGWYPVAYNAANEAAVDGFITGRIGFRDISSGVEAVLQGDWTAAASGTREAELAGILDADARARKIAADWSRLH